MSKELLDIYSGDRPYVFISYSHRDEALVFPLVRGMQQRGYRVWLDRGIEVGTEWSNNIADRLRRCEAVIFFVSKNSVASENCLDEVSFAKSHKKPAILIYLEEDVAMPEGMEMQTARFQRMYATRHADVASVVRALETAPILEPCREAPAPAPAPTPAPIPEAPSAVCPCCGASVRENSKFCDACGKPLQAAPAPTDTPVPAPGPKPEPIYTAVPEPPSAPAETPAPRGFAAKWRGMSKKKRVILIVIVAVVVLSLLGKLIATIVDSGDDAATTRVYMMVDMMTAFDNAGYETEVTSGMLELDTTEHPDLDGAGSFAAFRTTEEGTTDTVVCIYARCTDTATAEELYNEMVAELSGPSHVRTYTDFQRAVYTSTVYGVCEMVSLHDTVVVITYVDYSEFTDTYDHKPEDVLRSVNF